jgi:hypothetical protein
LVTVNPPDHHLVAAVQGDAVDYRVVPLAGVARDGDLPGVGAQMVGQPLPGRLAQRAELAPILKRRVRVDVPGEAGHGVDDDEGGGTEVRGIHHCQTGSHRKLVLHELPERFVVLGRCIGEAGESDCGRLRGGGARQGRGGDGGASKDQAEKLAAVMGHHGSAPHGMMGNLVLVRR